MLVPSCLAFELENLPVSVHEDAAENEAAKIRTLSKEWRRLCAATRAEQERDAALDAAIKSPTLWTPVAPWAS